MNDAREHVLREIRALIPQDERVGRALYDLVMDYPLREAKGLRPALAVAACRALGGTLEAVLQGATVLELFHNAFLVHDDIEDLSELRRGAPTLHRAHGVPIAVNVGDAMFAMSLRPLLDNVASIGLGPALQILECVADMCRESVEGQALELSWVRTGRWDLDEADYVDMVVKKTGWYSFVAPLRGGAISAWNPEAADGLAAFGRDLGVAFQIQDDLLNLDGEVGAYGKEIAGDLWEGKRTLMLLHALEQASEAERRQAVALLNRPRPSLELHVIRPSAESLLRRLLAEGALRPEGVTQVDAWMAKGPRCKTEGEVCWLHDLIRRTGAMDYAREVALAYAERAQQRLEACDLPESVHSDFLHALVDHVVERSR